VELDLSANTNLWGACPPAVDVLRGDPSPGSYPTPYADELKRAISETWGVAPGAVVTGCGSDDLIDSAIRAFCEPGAVVAFPAPTFPMIDVFAAMNDAVARPVPLAPDGSLSGEALRILADADVAYVCRPNNPTGSMVPGPQVEELLDRARGLVLLDEAYGEFAGESLVGPAVQSGRAVVLRTFSKAYGLAGLRVGYALGPEPLVRVIERSRGPYKVGTRAEQAAAAAMRDGAAWLDETVAAAVHARQDLAKELQGRGLLVRDSQANFVLVGPEGGGLDHGPGTRTGRQTAGWAGAVRAALLEQGISVRAFQDLPGMGDAIRVTVGPAPVMARFLATLDDAMAGLEVTP
jgi:histidinol-phosphate aminotransferase